MLGNTTEMYTEPFTDVEISIRKEFPPAIFLGLSFKYATMVRVSPVEQGVQDWALPSPSAS